jgi:hypothetical protein
VVWNKSGAKEIVALIFVFSIHGMAVNSPQARRSTRNQCAEYGVVDVLELESIALE